MRTSMVLVCFLFLTTSGSCSSIEEDAEGAGGVGGRSDTGGVGGKAGGGGKVNAGNGGSNTSEGGQGGSPSPDASPFTSDAAAPDAGTIGAGDTNAVAYDPCPGKGTACKIMPLGDSITMIPGYRVGLFRKSRAAGRTITYVGKLTEQSPETVDGVPFPKQHEGYNGTVIDGIRDLIQQEITTYRPHIVLLMIGTNDVHRSQQLTTAPERVGLLVDTIAKTDPNALIVVAKIVPTREDPKAQYYSAGQDARIRAFNDALGPVLEQRKKTGKHVVVVDMYAAFTANPNYKTAYLNENLHPSAGGFGVMTDVWWSAINAVVK